MRFKHKILIALAFIVGATPFIDCAQACAQESQWLDDYKQPVGFTYGAEATVNAMYIWRGLAVGAFNIQPYANVGYGGLYFDMWWNIGTADWTFTKFQPEVDLQLGFARWGINASVMFIHNFNCGFFDFSNHPEGGNGLEVRLRYTVSSKLPLSFLWATRVGASDGYWDEKGNVIRAYSTYAELSYTQKLPYDISLYGAVGITPWRSFYTGYQRSFAVQNIELRLRKDWSVAEHCGLMIQGVLSINPSAIAADKTSVQWHPSDLGNQSINANIAFGVYLK
jgi:hypothetical protein